MGGSKKRFIDSNVGAGTFIVGVVMGLVVVIGLFAKWCQFVGSVLGVW